MQTQISAEEFARFQTQLLELREQKYAAEEERNRSNRLVNSLEEALAQRSVELAELQSSLSRVHRAGDIDVVLKENQTLRQRLINIESSFQFQASTLRAECERLQSENAVLLATLKTAGATNEKLAFSDRSDNFTQTAFQQTSIFTQTYKAGWGCIGLQTDLTIAHLDELNNRLEELSGVKIQLQGEQETSKSLLTHLSRCEIDVERLEGECEVLKNQLAVNERRGERVQKELRRQLASALRSANRTSSSSLVYVQHSDTLSVDSFSLVGGNGISERSVGPDTQDEKSETSSNSHAPISNALFSEEDLKVRANAWVFYSLWEKIRNSSSIDKLRRFFRVCVRFQITKCFSETQEMIRCCLLAYSGSYLGIFCNLRKHVARDLNPT